MDEVFGMLTAMLLTVSELYHGACASMHHTYAHIDEAETFFPSESPHHSFQPPRLATLDDHLISCCYLFALQIAERA
jgi:hypothetical protein